MTRRQHFAREMREALAAGGFTDITMTYVPVSPAFAHKPLHRALAICPCGSHSGFMIPDTGQSDVRAVADRVVAEHLRYDLEYGK